MPRVIEILRNEDVIKLQVIKNRWGSSPHHQTCPTCGYQYDDRSTTHPFPCRGEQGGNTHRKEL